MLIPLTTVLTTYFCVLQTSWAQIPVNDQVALTLTGLKNVADTIRLENTSDPEEKIRIMRGLLSNNSPGIITRFIEQSNQAIQRGADTFSNLLSNSGGSNPFSASQRNNPIQSILQQGSKTAQDGTNSVRSLLSRSNNPLNSILEQGSKTASSVQSLVSSNAIPKSSSNILQNSPLGNLLRPGGSNPLEGVLDQSSKNLQEGTKALRNALSPQRDSNLLSGLQGSNPISDIIKQSSQTIQDGANSFSSLLRGGSMRGSNNPFSSFIDNGLNFLSYLRNLISNMRNNST